ncbi:glycosyltransferase [Acetobacter sacchari]|uniref:Glycosyltransferase n=1 Tax=Acetobacter sacchari TaxID=2661687 RepID=A0ABS3LT41_9PROT|nr:glycosyltransferase [Acetobacter sacchari]MBO1359073.1 glycosyltransferase [Acetobacter sacchari]
MNSRRDADKAAAVVQVFAAGLGRLPERSAVEHFVSVLETLDAPFADVTAVERMADMIVGSDEFRQRYGDKHESDVPFVRALFLDALGREATALEYMRFARQSGRASVLAEVAVAPEIMGRFDPFEWLYPRGAPVQDDRAYALWAERYDSEAGLKNVRLAAGQKPSITFLLNVPAWRFDLLEETLVSLLAQTHSGWSACVAASVDDFRTVERLLDAARTDPRVRVFPVLPDVDARQVTFQAAETPFIAFIEPGDRLMASAVQFIAEVLAELPETALLYTDEDRIDAHGRRWGARFKPGWSDDQLLGGDTIGQLAVMARERIIASGGLDAACACVSVAEADDVRPWSVEERERAFQLAVKLRVAEATTTDRIVHLPRVLFHRGRGFSGPSPMVAARVSPQAPVPVEQAVVSRHIADCRPGLRLTETSLDVAASAAHGMLWPRVLYPLPTVRPTVSIVILTRDNPDLLARCLSGLLYETDYPAFDVTIVDNGGVEPEAAELLRQFAVDPRVMVRRIDTPFNWAALNNEAARGTNGQLLLLLNDDIEILRRDWLDELVRQALRPGVGVVGARLLYPDGALQHGGMALTPDGATHILRSASPGEGGYLGQIAWQRDMLAVTGACLLIHRALFEELGGLDEEFHVTCNDVDLCLRVVATGRRVVWTPHAVLTHIDGATRGRDHRPERQVRFFRETARLIGRWSALVASDATINPNLKLTDRDILLTPPTDQYGRPDEGEVAGLGVKA